MVEQHPSYDVGGASAEMPRYVTCKQVWALKIASIEAVSPTEARLHFVDAGYAPRVMAQDWIEKRGAEAGGYLVVYRDGYTSWSPAQAFEESSVPEIAWGIPRAQEPKYSMSPHGRIVNRHTGKPIPTDEPLFIVRAQDRCALPLLSYYRSIVSPQNGVQASVDERLLAFSNFRTRHPDRMKDPDGAPPPPPVPHSIQPQRWAPGERGEDPGY